MNSRITASALLIAALTTSTVAEPALTIYNQDFAVVRETVPLDLKAGVNQVRFTDATAYVEPGSVVLRDPTGRHEFVIREQNYRADPVTQDMLLSLNEGKTIQFEVVHHEGGQSRRELISGKIIRGNTMDLQQGRRVTYGFGGFGTPTNQAIIEVNGQLRFGLPGLPLFPALTDDTILKPTLQWQLETDQSAKFDAELSYVSGGMKWSADYNLVMPEKGDSVDLVGWVTMENQSGRTFEQARVKLMAGDVNKIQEVGGYRGQNQYGGGGFGGGGLGPPVTEKTFDEYHLYSLEHATTLHNLETKQVEFVRAGGVKSKVLYVYDGVAGVPFHFYYQGRNPDPNYGTESNKKVWVMREFMNSVSNQLGMPLPKGKLRFYRRDRDGQVEFIGENEIEHTPRDEQIRVNTGSAFDLVGERKQTEFNLNPPGGYPGSPGFPGATSGVTFDQFGNPVFTQSGSTTNTPTELPWISESFEITVRNHKSQPVEVRVVEHLYRWTNWKIVKQSDASTKIDAQTVEFPIQLAPDEEHVVAYTVHYYWW